MVVRCSCVRACVRSFVRTFARAFVRLNSVRFFPINAPRMGRFKLFDLVGYSM